MSTEDTALRIAVVITAVGVGGTESQGALLVRELAGRGATVEVLVLDGRVVSQNFGSAKVRVLAPQRMSRGIPVLAAAMGASRLWWALRRGQFDVVHAMMARAHVLAPLCVPSGAGRPFVVAWRRNVGAHSGNRILDWVERQAARRTDLLVANSDPVLDYWCQRGHKPRSGYAVILNALEAWRFQPTEAEPLALARRHVVSVGNLRAVKGHVDLLTAAAEVRTWGIDVGVVIVGEGPLERDLTVQAIELGVPLRIATGVRDPRPYLRAADVYVQSSHQEGSSNAVGEAMAQGCVVVTTDTGDAAELVGDAGWVVPAGRPHLLAKALHECLIADVRTTSQAVVERARNLRSVDRMVGAHVKLYREGIKDVRHRRGG